MGAWIGDKLERFAYDSEGRRIRHRERGVHEVKCNPTRGYYDDGRDAEKAEHAGRMYDAIDSLTDEERDCLMLHEARGTDLDRLLRERLTPEALATLLGKTRSRRETREIRLAEEADFIAAGWSLVSRQGRRAVVEKSFAVQLGYDAIARVVGLTPNQARGRCLRAYEKLRSATAHDAE